MVEIPCYTTGICDSFTPGSDYHEPRCMVETLHEQEHRQESRAVFRGLVVPMASPLKIYLSASSLDHTFG